MRPAALLLMLLAGRASAAGPTTPEAHARMALEHRQSLPLEQQKYAWYLSFWDLEDEPAEKLWDYRRYLSWWVNQMSFERRPSLVKEVSGSDGRLVWVDLRDYTWNSRARLAVGSRDPRCREPWISFEVAEALRKGAGYEGIQPNKDGTRPLIVMVNALWFIRETLETRRSPSYYDLLFAQWRFHDNYTEAKTEYTTENERHYHGGGDFHWLDGTGRVTPRLREGWYMVPIRRLRKVGTQTTSGAYVDFPRNVDDWNKAFGIDVIAAFGKGRGTALDFGAIVAGGRDDPERGSIVTLNNRLVVTIRGPYGAAMRTYDTFESTGDRDYSEKLIFKDGKFIKGDGADAVFDAGELLSYIPNGGQAGLLINGQGNRVETAVADAANDSREKKENGQPLLNQGVRNYGSCLTCHAGSGGFIMPRDEEEDDRRRGIKRKYKDPDQQRRYEEFFDDWQDQVDGFARPYQKLIKKTTVHPHKQMVPIAQNKDQAREWSGTDIEVITEEIRRRYDAPVTPERGAREMGLPVEAFKYLCSRGGVSPDGKTRNHRLNQLVQGKAIPSRTWEIDDFKQVGTLLDAYRQEPSKYPGLKELMGAK